VNWFEIPTVDLDRAKKFYENVFEIRMGDSIGNAGYQMIFFPSVMGEYGTSGSLITGMGYKPTLEGVTIYFSVSDIDSTYERVTSNGGIIHVPKKDIGEYGKIAIFEDPEGNRIGLHQM